MDTQRSPVSKRQLQEYACENNGRIFRAIWKQYKKTGSVSKKERLDILKIDTKHMKLERALRKFRAYGKELKQELLERKEYKKPSVKRNATRQAALRRNRRKNQEAHNSQANWKALDRKLKRLRDADALDSEI